MVVCSLSGCGLFDSGVEWRDGPYELLWIDLPSQLSLNYDIGRDGGSLKRVRPPNLVAAERAWVKFRFKALREGCERLPDRVS